MVGHRAEIMETRGECPDAIKARRPEAETPEFIFVADCDVQSPEWLAIACLSERAGVRCRTAHGGNAALRDSLASLTVAYTDRATGIAIEQRVLSPKVQAWVVEEKPDRNRAQLTGGGFAQRLVERMQDPLSSLLHLGCDCERVVFLGQSLAVLLYNSANRYTADNGRRNTEALEHAGSPVDKGKKGESCGEETQTDTRNRREPGFVSAYCDENSG